MTYTQSSAPRSRFRVGEALQATFDAVFNNFVVFLLLALVILAAPNFLVAIAFPPSNATAPTALVGVILRGVVSLVAAALLQGALVRGVITHMNGGKPRFDECLRVGLSNAAPLVAIALLFGLAVGFGLVLLVAPGLFLLALWGVVAPVQVAERRGVFGSFSRSADLTDGARWAVLGALVVMGLVSLLATLIGGAVTGVIGGLAGLAAGGLGGGLAIVGTAVGAVSAAVGAIFSNAAPAAIYSALRRAKEGAAPAELAAVFD